MPNKKETYKTIKLEPKYVPKIKEEYMSEKQKAYFYELLMGRKEETQAEIDSVLETVKSAEKSSTAGVGDDSDNSHEEQELTMRLRMSERQSNLLKKIDFALSKIENGTFGFSVISGDEIGIKRMMARPLATMTIEEQEEIEKQQS